MKSNTILKHLLLFIISIGIMSCKKKQQHDIQTDIRKIDVGVFNFDDKQELFKYNELNLDKTHPNLLNPQISKSDYNAVMNSWTDVHQRLGAYLSKNRFNWEVEDKSISIVHKIYFNSNGNIENYFFNVLNANVSKEKKEQFAKLIADFCRDNRIDFKNNGSFAQCGKTKYINE